MIRATVLTILVCAAAAPLAAQQPLVQTVAIEGATVYSSDDIASRQHIMPGAPLPVPPGELAEKIRRQYERDDYTLATVEATLDAVTGALTIRIDEGRFDSVDVTGVSEDLRARLLDTLAIQPGIFNESQARRALNEALAFAYGAIEQAPTAFTLMPDAGRRVLQIALRSRSHRTNVVFGSQGREDWYSPVDELNVGWGIAQTFFDSGRFNHTLVSGHASYKTGPERASYSFGIERPFFTDALLQVGGSIHDLTATDDEWRLGDDEQSLVAVTFRNTFRDYYRRKGYQLHAALRPLANHEFIVAWRDDRHFSLANETNYGFFRDDHDFRPNATALNGDIRSLILGYTFDTRGLARQSPARRFQRHLLDDLYGERTDRDQGVRIDWRSELAPDSFDHAVDFNRHIATLRTWWTPSARRLVSARLIAGGSSGVLPPQRLFALGGTGSVHGYRFKEAAGQGMVVVNAEFRQQFRRHGLAGIAFVDAGRVYDGAPGATTDWLRGVGVGLELDDHGPRIEFGWRLDDIPKSLQVLFRLRPTF